MSTRVYNVGMPNDATTRRAKAALSGRGWIEDEHLIAAILANPGASVVDLCRSLGIRSDTYYARFRDPRFVSKLATERGKAFDMIRAKTVAELERSLNTAVHIRDHGGAKDSDRLAASRLLIDTAIDLSDRADTADRLRMIEATVDSLLNGDDSDADADESTPAVLPASQSDELPEPDSPPPDPRSPDGDDLGEPPPTHPPPVEWPPDVLSRLTGMRGEGTVAGPGDRPTP